MGCMGGLCTWLYGTIFGPPQPHQPPPPPQDALYGYRWQAGQGVPNPLSIFAPSDPMLPGGLYVGFQSFVLSNGVDPFGRAGGGMGLGLGPVYPAPPAVSAALQTLIDDVAANPPQNQGDNFNDVTPDRLRDVDGFFSYVDNCLTLLRGTPAGQQLLNQLTGGARRVYITPALMTNQTAIRPLNSGMSVLCGTVLDFLNNQPIDGAAIDAMVNQRYQAIVGAPARYAQLAEDMNALRLCSLYEAENTGTANFLAVNYLYNGGPLDGPTLQNWLTVGDPLYDTFLRTSVLESEGVRVRQYVLLALILLLNADSPPGPLGNATVEFNVRVELDNQLGTPGFRPPAVGLAHELMHAMHYTSGTAPGSDIGSFTTTAAELLFVGIAPFQAVPVSENAIRMAWGGLAPDASNVWAVPARRTTYEPPPPGQTPQDLREQYGGI